MAFKIELNNVSGVPYYRQIVNGIMYGIINGLLKPGDKLPTVRELAVNLQINLNTIIKAYKELEIRGVLNTQQGTGTFISRKKMKVDNAEKARLLHSKCIYFIDEITSLGIDSKEALDMLHTIYNEKRSKQNAEKKQA